VLLVLLFAKATADPNAAPLPAYWMVPVGAATESAAGVSVAVSVKDCVVATCVALVVSASFVVTGTAARIKFPASNDPQPVAKS
jgi:hypothetical protein